MLAVSKQAITHLVLACLLTGLSSYRLLTLALALTSLVIACLLTHLLLQATEKAVQGAKQWARAFGGLAVDIAELVPPSLRVTDLIVTALPKEVPKEALKGKHECKCRECLEPEPRPWP